VDLKQIEKLMAAMEHARIRRVSLKKEDFEIEIERECMSDSPRMEHALPPYVSSPLSTSPSSPPSLKSHAEAAAVAEEKTGELFVTSPMVGTFFSSPSPDDPPFVKPGDAVTEDTVVCIIEAMKVMNEVKAGVKGTITAVMVKNGEPVEFGTRIMRVVP
jgi:acetyl-CoA carboxylase biotin carboxyl carrier protein